MKVENYSYETFPEFDEYVDGMVELNGVKDNLRVRLLDVNYQDDCIIRFLFPNTILDDKRKYPLIIHVQGSGWYKQDMNDHIFDYMPIVKHGYVIALIEHHPSPKYKFPTQLDDVKTAIRYIKDHYEKYPIDINNVYLSGDSSGGHLALMTLFTYDEDLLPLSGMIDYYGLTDFTTFYDDGYSKYDETDFTNIYDLLGEYKEDHLELYKEASPIYHIHENMKLPPMLILHGSKDHVVPFEQSVKLYKKLKEHNYNTTLCKVNHADHGRSIFYVKEVYDYIINFLNRYKKD